MYYDLHLPVRRGNPAFPDRRKSVMQELRRYGYGTVANVVEVRGTLKLEKQKDGVESVFMNEEKRGTGLKGGFNTLGDSKSIQQLRRISVVCESTEDAKRLLTPSSHILRMYDLISAKPCSSATFAILCEDAQVDIIELEPGNWLAKAINGRLINKALSRGVSFEMRYSEALGSTTSRRRFFACTQAFVIHTRGRGLILSSGAESPLKIRSPHDIINLARLVGLSGAAAAGVVGRNSAKAIKMAQVRRQVPCRGAMDIGVSLLSGQLESGLEELLSPPNETDENEGKDGSMEYMELSDKSCSDENNDLTRNDH